MDMCRERWQGDLVLVPLSAIGKWDMWHIFFVAWIASLLGGATAHYFGRKLGKPVFIKFFGKEMFGVGEKFLNHWGMWSVVIAAATPVPFKVMAWMAGILEMKFWKFFIAQAIGRAIRFSFVLWVFELIKQTDWYIGLF